MDGFWIWVAAVVAGVAGLMVAAVWAMAKIARDDADWQATRGRHPSIPRQPTPVEDRDDWPPPP